QVDRLISVICQLDEVDNQKSRIYMDNLELALSSQPAVQENQTICIEYKTVTNLGTVTLSCQNNR
ncbi:MAG: hypothetical protein ACKPEO_08100, partial [Sphaerospermopsis kisseleviana]